MNNLKELLEQFQSVYDALYNCPQLEDYLPVDDLIEKTSNYFHTEAWQDFIRAYYKETHDVLASDREYLALAIVQNL